MVNSKSFFISFLLLLIFAPIFFNNDFRAQNVVINEFMASNVASTPEIVDYDDYSDWIEIYNNSDKTISLTGYALSDDLDNPEKWIFPDGTFLKAKSYLFLWADGYNDTPGDGIKYYHLNFKLSQDGEEIGIFSSSGELIDSVKFGPQLSDVSYGRKLDGTREWFYFGEPTPGSANITAGTKNIIYSEKPDISLTSGFYQGSQILNITNSSEELIITYTTDGSRPSSSSQVYSTPLEISENTVLRFRAIEDGKLPSRIITRTYFIDQEQNLPVISMTVIPETFFDEEIGIYDRQIKEREVPVNMQYFERDGQLAFEVDAGVRLSGQASFQYPQKPLTIEVDNRYGYESINYPVFSNRPFNRYTSLYLRNSGTQDHRHTLFRDALQHTLVINQMDIDCQAYQPVSAFINGEYWGIYNLREKLDNAYLVNHHGINPDNLDYLEYEFNPNPVVIEGGTDEFFTFQNFLSSNSMNIEENWEYVKSKVDVNEVMNYLITEIYCDNYNWPNTNSRWWRERSETGKWRYIFLDSDYGFGAPSWYSHYSNNTLEFMYSQPPFSTFVFRKLLENKDFKNEFIQRFATYLNTVFSTERLLNIFDSLKAQINAEMIYHIDRWNDDPSPIFNYPPIPSIAGWNNEVNIMREFASERNRFMKQHIKDFFHLGGITNVKFSVTNNESGYIELGDIRIKNGYMGDYYRYVPIKIRAVAAIGYKFVKWIGVIDSLSPSTFYTPLRSDSTIQVTAVFVEDNINILPSEISQNSTLDISGSPYYAKGDIKVNSGVKLSVDPGVKILMPGNSNILIKGEIEVNGDKENPVSIEANNNAGYSNWGIMYFDSASAPCTLRNIKLIGATQILDADSGKIGAISSYKSDLTIDGLSIQDAPFPIFTRYGNIVVRNSQFYSEETCDLINIKYAETALVENCEFRGNNSFDTDAIDYDQISSGIIRNNRIYNFYGFNSDGIDLGEGSKDIIIENNLVLNCNDKGISVGQASTTEIKNNIIVNCAQGVGIKDDSSFAIIDRNTFHSCDYGVASFEKNLGAGGGNADIVNSIFSESVLAPVFVDELSVLNISYSLSDTEELDGLGNLRGDAEFSNNFFLTSSSPAINSGDPTRGNDPDGTLPDMGARFYTESNQPLIINEIHYNPNNGENYEFIEIYNTSSREIDLYGYSIIGAIDFFFPVNSTIDPKGFVVVAKDPSAYNNIDQFIYGWGTQTLPNSRGDLKLIDNSESEIDFVSYSNRFNWPTLADGAGYSLELKNPKDENLDTKNWKASENLGGSPGRENRVALNNQLFINEFQADNKSTIKDSDGQYDDWVEIYNAGDNVINVGNIFITDNFENLTKHSFRTTNTESDFIQPKEKRILWADGDADQGSNHLNFRLNNNGEEIALSYIFDEDTTIIDSISFGFQETDFSYARQEDGGENWTVVKVPTPGERNNYPGLFKKGILLVNGYRFSIDQVIDMYENKSLWGNNRITFWDILPEISVIGYPSTLPEPSGHGQIPLDTLFNYSTVIWTGENISSEIVHWNNSPLLRYVNMGGNLVLLLRNGIGYLNETMTEKLGITWINRTNVQIMSCIPVYEGLDSISIENGQYISTVFDTNLTNDKSKLLFVDNADLKIPVGVGVWNQPEYGGWYKENGGQLILLCGRGYRYNHNDLKKNMEYILKNFLEEDDIITDSFDNDDKIITKYNLDQNYPNPFNPLTVIKYDLAQSTNVELKIYNILGEEVKTLVNKFQEKGRRTVIWKGVDNFDNKVSSGIYLYRISAGNWSDIKKMIMLK